MKISPSIASANPLRLEEEVQRVSKQYDDLHIDIEDGNFIPNITFGMKTIKALRSITELPFSFHLMVTNLYDYLDEIFDLSPSIIFAHVEALDYPSEFVQRVKERNVKCGLAFNPKTPVEPYSYLFNKIDGILIMTSEPDGLGQVFIPEMIEKVKTLSKYENLNSEIWVDGGVRNGHLELLKGNGVNCVVMGRELFARD